MQTTLLGGFWGEEPVWRLGSSFPSCLKMKEFVMIVPIDMGNLEGPWPILIQTEFVHALFGKTGTVSESHYCI